MTETNAGNKLPIPRGRERRPTDAIEHRLEIYTPEMKVTGLMDLIPGRRLSDVMNEPTEHFLALREAQFQIFRGAAYLPPVEVGVITIGKRTSTFVIPHADDQTAQFAAPHSDLVRVKKLPQYVYLHTAAFLIQGAIHLVRGIHLHDALNVSPENFIAMTDVTIFHLAAPDLPPITRHFASVNRDHVTAIYLCPDTILPLRR